MLPSEIKLEDVEIWFQDEARVGQRGTVTRLWAIKGTRPRAIRQQQFAYAYIFGAICPQRDLAVGYKEKKLCHPWTRGCIFFHKKYAHSFIAWA